ncbi:30S ribosomal protein THX [Pontibacter sp. E15-1]|uniref:30S ribosomal protein THX n=1 Tax=Pontibacter sp. E15-1 TaxID=2919918 RepID=UPI001F4FB17A|nr:30S ribosomal protein THX [Pontibacter sp. E15-1]MCJ8164808.1 30S ribosomal protein THX [Pontibacter sp. E15-1]
MGKGDIKSRKGKITKGTYGNRRPHKASKGPQQATPQPKAETKAEAPKAEAVKAEPTK